MTNPKPDTYLYGRPVYIDKVYLDGCDSFIEAATYADTLEALTDGELEDLTSENGDYLVDKCFERLGHYKK
jgi:hypothetical protein